MILAIVQPFKVDQVTIALEHLPGFGGMTVSECIGFGHGKVAVEGELGTAGSAPLEGSRDRSRRRSDSAAGVTDFTPKMRIEIAVNGRARADAVVSAVTKAAHTGRKGDGKVFLWPLSEAVRIRSFDVNAKAL